MTKEEILAMEAGDKLNREVNWYFDLPRYTPVSTDISAAWQVVEKLTEDWKLKGKPISIEVSYDCGAYETKIETWNEKNQTGTSQYLVVLVEKHQKPSVRQHCSPSWR